VGERLPGGSNKLAREKVSEVVHRRSKMNDVETVECKDCGGAGVKPGLLDGFLAGIDCKTCEGTGKVPKQNDEEAAKPETP